MLVLLSSQQFKSFLKLVFLLAWLGDDKVAAGFNGVLVLGFNLFRFFNFTGEFRLGSVLTFLVDLAGDSKTLRFDVFFIFSVLGFISSFFFVSGMHDGSGWLGC